MPNIKSAKKRVKVNNKAAERNKAIKSNLKTVLKNAETAIETNSATKADDVKLAVKKIDMAVSKGLIHKNKAARKKSQIVKKLNASNAN